MPKRQLRRALVLAAAGLFAFTGIASADISRADGDPDEPGLQSIIELGEVAPSEVVSATVWFDLRCSTTNHVDVGQTLNLTWSAQSAPAGGAVLSATPVTTGPVPAGWPADGASCPEEGLVLAGSTSTVTLRAPAVPNVGYIYTVGWLRSFSPAGNLDGSAVTNAVTSISFRLAVVEHVDEPPVVTSDGDRTVAGDTTGGWTATYPDVVATDAEDDPDPDVTCTPAAGSVLPVGTTTVTCTATDSNDQSDSESFAVTVEDNVAPTLAGLPSDQVVTTEDPSGTTLSYAAPTATDVVDPTPSVTCDPASGTPVGLGVTTVTCTATDASGNPTSGTFDVDVRYVPAHVAEATFGEPIGEAAVFYANRGRTVPVKVTFTVDGAPQRTGDASLRLVPCGGADAVDVALAVERRALGAGPRHVVAGRLLLRGHGRHRWPRRRRLRPRAPGRGGDQGEGPDPLTARHPALP